MTRHAAAKASLVTALLFASGCTKTGTTPSASSEPPGRALLSSKGCVACHSINGQPGVGPTFFKLFGKTEKLSNGSTIVVDETYIKESIRNPTAKVVANFAPSMPVMPLTDSELQSIVDFIKTLK